MEGLPIASVTQQLQEGDTGSPGKHPPSQLACCFESQPYMPLLDHADYALTAELMPLGPWQCKPPPACLLGRSDQE